MTTTHFKIIINILKEHREISTLIIIIVFISIAIGWKLRERIFKEDLKIIALIRNYFKDIFK